MSVDTFQIDLWIYVDAHACVDAVDVFNFTRLPAFTLVDGASSLDKTGKLRLDTLHVIQAARPDQIVQEFEAKGVLRRSRLPELCLDADF